MKTIDIDAAAAEDLLVRIAAHLPSGHVLGRPLVARGDQVLTATGFYLLEDDGCSASRLEALADDRAELTTWAHGVEISRIVAHAE